MHQVWVQSWLQLLVDLQAYVKQFHTTGLAWNPKGGKFDGNSQVKPAIPPKPVTSSKANPPPPPPMPTFDLFAQDGTNPVKAESPADIQAKLKQELTKGMDITKSLKKVSDDQKTHKNPALRAGSTVPVTAPSAASARSTPSNSAASAKPPKLELNDKKWSIVRFILT
jgi:adenylyl cyclase-associated protein